MEDDKIKLLNGVYARLSEHFKNIVILVEDDENTYRKTTLGNAPYGMCRTYCLLFEQLTSLDAIGMRDDDDGEPV